MGVDQSAVSRVTGVAVEFKIFESGGVTNLPQRIALVGQGNSAATFALTKLQITDAQEPADVFGFGSPLHLAALQLFPANGDGVGSIPVTVYPLEDEDSSVAAAGTIEALGTQTEQLEYIVKINKIPAASTVIPVGTTASAAITLFKTSIDATLKLPVTSGANTGVELSLDITSKWKGESANDIYVEIEGVEAGIAFTITQLTGGLVNPDIDDALNNVGTVWETMILNCLNYDDVATLTKVKDFCDGRWDELVKQPVFSINGTGDDRATRTAITDARKTDKRNALIPAPGSKELPFVIAARAVARIAPVANNTPAVGYAGHLTGLVPGLDSDQESHTQRDVSLKAGSGTTILVNGEIELNDTITMHHPDGDVNPAFRYIVNLVKLQNIVFNVRLIMEATALKGAPLLPDNTPTTEPLVVKPKNIKTRLGNLADALALKAIIADAEFTKANLTAAISTSNPNRLENAFPVKLSGNIEINDTTIYFGFYFGSPVIL